VANRDRRSYASRLAAALGLCALVAAAGGGAAGSAGSIPACRGGEYELELGNWNVRGNVLAVAGILAKGGPVCRLKTTVRIAVRYHHAGNVDPPKGPVRPVRGNPTRWHVSRVLRPWSQVVHTWTWRNWCRRPRHEFLVLAGSSATGSVRISTRITAPVCRDRHVSSTLADTASGTRLVPATGDRIPAHILPQDAPIPVSPTLIRVRNAWLVSDGRTLVAVYAGEAGNDPARGLFVIIRHNLVFGNRWQDVVPAGHTGAVELTQVPLGPAVETSAQHADLSFISHGGRHGVLHLATDAVEIAP
jgi:hypothetical protein